MHLNQQSAFIHLLCYIEGVIVDVQGASVGLQIIPPLNKHHSDPCSVTSHHSVQGAVNTFAI